jgi:hypothetical protein
VVLDGKTDAQPKGRTNKAATLLLVMVAMAVVAMILDGRVERKA